MPIPVAPPMEYPPFYSRKGIPLASAHKESPTFAACWPALQGSGWTCGDDVMSPERVTSVSSDERHARLHMAYVFPPREGVIAPEAIFLFTDVNGAVTARFTHMALSPLARVAVTMLETSLGLCETTGSAPPPSGTVVDDQTVRFRWQTTE